MFASLMPDLIGIGASPAASVPIASRAGFAGLDLRINRYANDIERLGSDALRDAMEAANLRPGYCSITSQKLNVPDHEWDADMADVGRRAEIAQTLGYTRATSVVVPFDADLAPAANRERHIRRIREAARVLADFGIRFGLEYVSPKTRWAGMPNPFVRDLAGMLDLLAEVDRPNAGVMLDCFHWHCAGEHAGDIRKLDAAKVIAVHVNDLVAGRSVEEQTVTERELPGVSGIIDLDAFMGALADIGYDGPVTAEPTHPRWKETPDDEAAAATARAVRACVAKAESRAPAATRPVAGGEAP